MSKIKAFITKYKTYILIGLAIGLVISIILAIYLLRNPKEEPITIKNIGSPFITQEVNTDILNTDEIEITEETMIYQILQPEEYIIKDFVDNYNKSDDSLSETDETLLWNFSSNYFAYNKETSVMFIIANGGIKTDITAVNKENIEKYIEGLMSDIDIVNLQTEKLENGHIRYSGMYNIKDIEIGSIHIEGNGVIAEFDTNGNLYKMNILLIDPSKISEYQKMPQVELSTLLNISKYPKFFDIKEYDQEYTNQFNLLKVTTDIYEIEARETQYKMLFQDYEHGYIFPGYMISGDGRMKDSQGNKYWVDVDTYICAISSEYLNEKEIEEVHLVDVGVE